MATKLQCEICGGKLVGKPGGIFECENCGTEYSTEWAKAKIQEITGTVKVEGTVEVTGKVQVDTAANKDNLLKRGFMLLEESTSKNPTWKTADEYFDKVLDIDAECGEAYLGKLMIEAKVRKRSDLASSYVGRQADWENSSFFQKAFQYGNIALRHELTELVRKKTYDKARERSSPIPGRVIIRSFCYHVDLHADVLPARGEAFVYALGDVHFAAFGDKDGLKIRALTVKFDRAVKAHDVQRR